MFSYTYISFVLAIVTILLDVTACRSHKGKHVPKKLSGSKDFDLLIFTQHWPQTVCYKWKKESEGNSCSLPTDEEWTIHGLWPTQLHKIGPQYCNHSLHFNASQLAPIEENLNVKWIDIEKGKASHQLWRHEWEKHGTCAAVIDTLNTELKYFQYGLNLLQKYDMKDILGQAGIFAGENYPVQKILDGIEKVLQKRAAVICIKNSKSNQSYLFEIRLCFDKSLQLIDCDGVVEFPTNCNESQDIFYPSSVPLSNYHVSQV